jgi:hypothetical protein
MGDREARRRAAATDMTMPFLCRVRFVTAAICFLLPTAVFSQSKATKPQIHNSESVQELPELRGPGGPFQPLRLMLHSTSWVLFAMKKSGFHTASEAMADLGSWLPTGHLEDGISQVEAKLVAKHRNDLLESLKGMEYVGDDEGKFIYKAGHIPFTFARKEKSLVLAVSALALGSVYNTLLTTDRSRASKVFSSTVLPAARDLSVAISSAEIEYFAVEVCYGSRDFSEDEALNTHGEILIAVIPADKARQFARARITGEDLLAASEVYLFPSSTNALEKVRLTLQ